MKKISKKLKFTISLILVLGFMTSYAQETKTDTIHLTTKKIIGEETIVWDTIIVVSPENEDAVNEYLKKQHKGVHISRDFKGGSKHHANTISMGSKKLKVHVDSDIDADGKAKILTYTIKDDHIQKADHRLKIFGEKLPKTGEGEHELEIVLESDESGDYEIIWEGDSMHQDMKNNIWISKDGKDKKYEFVVVDGKDGIFSVHELKDSLKNVIVELIHEGGDIQKEMKEQAYTFISCDGDSFTIDSLHEHLNIIKEMKHGSKDARVFIYHDGDRTKEFKVHNDLTDEDEEVIFIGAQDKEMRKWHFGEKFVESVDVEFSDKISDKEISELGIKTEAKELKVEDFWMFYNDEKELRLKFSMDTEGKTTIKVLDARGKALFTDKVVYFPGTYDKKIALDAKHKSPLYIYVEQGNASTIKKLSVY